MKVGSNGHTQPPNGKAPLRRVVRPPKRIERQPKPKLAIREDHIAAARIKARARERRAAHDVINPFQLPPPLPGVPKHLEMAMDEGLMAVNNWAANGWAGLGGMATYSALAEGLTFLGYPYLAELAQRPEYRVIVQTIAEEMTRKWIEVQAIGDDKSEAIAAIEQEFKRLKVKEQFYQAAVIDGFFGRSHLYLDFDTWDDRDELKTSIGNGTDLRSSQKIGKQNPLKYIKCLEPIWVYPTYYDSTNPLRQDYYKPTTWYVQGLELHGSRLLTFISQPLSDILKPVYYFGGLSMIQMAKPYVENWLHTRQNVQDLIGAFSVFVLSTDLEATLNAGGQEVVKRAELFNDTRDNAGLMMINKDSEELNNISVPLGTLDTLQAQSQEHMASVSGIPLVKLLGISPHGLNASSEGEVRVFYDKIHARQEMLFDEPLRVVFNFVQLSLFGFVDPELTFTYVPLWSLDESQLVSVRKTEAETAQLYIEAGVLSQLEVRRALADDPDSPYEGLDVDDVPDLREEEEGGLEPEGGRPQPVAGGKQGEGEGQGEPITSQQLVNQQLQREQGHVAPGKQDEDPFAPDQEPFPTVQGGPEALPAAASGPPQVKRSDKLQQLVTALEAAAATRDSNSRYSKLAYLIAPREHLANEDEISRYQKFARLVTDRIDGAPDSSSAYRNLAKLIIALENNTNYTSRLYKLGTLLRDRPKDPNSRHAKLATLLREHKVDPNSRVGKLAMLLREHQVDPDSRYAILSKILNNPDGGELAGGPHPEAGEDDDMFVFDWEEPQHPRGGDPVNAGRFSKGSGGGSSGGGVRGRVQQMGQTARAAHANVKANAKQALTSWQQMSAPQRVQAASQAVQQLAKTVAHHFKEHLKEEAEMYKHAAIGIGHMAAGEWYGRLPEEERKAIKKALMHASMTVGSMMMGDPTGHSGMAIGSIAAEFALEHAHHAAILTPAQVGLKTAKHFAKQLVAPYDSAFDQYDVMGTAMQVASMLAEQVPDEDWAEILDDEGDDSSPFASTDEHPAQHGGFIDDLHGHHWSGEETQVDEAIDEFEAGKHPRGGDPDNPGRFSTSSGSGKSEHESGGHEHHMGEPGLVAHGLDVADKVKKQWGEESPIKSLDNLFAHAKENQDALAEVANAIEAEVDHGTKFLNPGVKGRPRTEEKVKQGKPPARINDVVRGGFTVLSPQQADRIVEDLAKHFEVADEDWAYTPTGYFDRKVILRFPNGQGAEVQLWHPNLLEAKEHGGGHDLYEQARKLPIDDPRHAELEKQMQEIFNRATASFGPEWCPPACPSTNPTVSGIREQERARTLTERGAEPLRLPRREEEWSEAYNPTVSGIREQERAQRLRDRDDAAFDASDELTYGSLDGDPFVWKPGEAWVLTEGKWQRVDSSEVGMEGKVLEKDDFDKRFTDLPPLPDDSFGGGGQAQDFEASKHPRGGDPDNPGRFSTSGGSGGESAKSGVSKHPQEDKGDALELHQEYRVMRLGSGKHELNNTNAGNARAVADHLVRIFDNEAPSFVGEHGDTITVYGVKFAKQPGDYQGQVGRTDKIQSLGRRVDERGAVAYAFPHDGQDFESRTITKIPLNDLMAQLKSMGYADPDEAGIDATAKAIDKLVEKSGESEKGEASGHPGHGYSKNAVLKDGKIYTSDVHDAARALYEKRKVVLDQPRQVSTLIEHLGKIAKQFEARGAKEPEFDLCDVSVEDTNLFCAESKGIPRVEMPQLPSKVKAQFLEHLVNTGHKIEEAKERASYFRATQNQLNGAKIGGMMGRLRSGVDPTLHKRPLIVSKDNYILDGHHNWAAQVGLEFSENRDPNIEFHVLRVDIGITELLDAAEKFTEGKGKKAVTDAALNTDGRIRRIRRARDEGGRFNARTGFAGANKRGFADTTQDKEFVESEHPRGGNPDNPGEFSEGAGGGASKRPKNEPHRISQRLPTGVKSTEDPNTGELEIGLEAMKKSMEAYEHNISLLRKYPNIRNDQQDLPTEKLTRAFIDHVKDNLHFIYDSVAPEDRKRSQLWYDGGRAIIDSRAEQLGVPEQAVGAVYACLSPQKDWFQNVSLGDRMLDIIHRHGDEKWSPEMEAKTAQIYAKPKFKPVVDAIRGKTFNELISAYEKAAWLRAYDEAHNSPGFPIINPEGTFGDVVKTKKGKQVKVAWQSLPTIAKGITALESNGDMDTISKLMGGKHKVRNFYNNLMYPDSSYGDVTIDTHAVAAALLRGLSSKSVEVSHNFNTNVPEGETGAAGSTITGAMGLYGLYAEAYRELAGELNILPRQLQSITWEGVRGLFPQAWKRFHAKEVDDIWQHYREGGISAEQARKLVVEKAGGFRAPDWSESEDGEE